MKLFFETGIQMRFFLFTLPLGFFVCFFLDSKLASAPLRMVYDLLVLMLCGICLVLYLLVFGDTSLRVYHLFGLVCGAILYMCGVGKCRSWMRRRFRRRKEGIRHPHDEKDTDRFGKDEASCTEP